MPPTSLLPSFPAGFRVAVLGATGGLGRAFVDRLSADPRAGRVYAGARNPSALKWDGVTAFPFDLQDEASIAAGADRAAADGPLHLVLVATGILHDGALQPEKSWRALTPDALHQVLAINAVGPALIAKHWLPLLARGEKAAFAALSARVGSIEDNRLGGWHSYRASKAALHQLVRTFAVELAARNPTALCVALHPGTVATALSQPFRPRDGVLDPADSAARLLGVLDGLTPGDSGRAYAWDGAVIPF